MLASSQLRRYSFCTGSVFVQHGKMYREELRATALLHSKLDDLSIDSRVYGVRRISVMLPPRVGLVAAATVQILYRYSFLYRVRSCTERRKEPLYCLTTNLAPYQSTRVSWESAGSVSCSHHVMALVQPRRYSFLYRYSFFAPHGELYRVRYRVTALPPKMLVLCPSTRVS